jgi:hypothetical protein
MKSWTSEERLLLQLELEKLDRRLAGCKISNDLKRFAHDVLYDAIDATTSVEPFRDKYIDYTEESLRKRKR